MVASPHARMLFVYGLEYEDPYEVDELLIQDNYTENDCLEIIYCWVILIRILT